MGTFRRSGENQTTLVIGGDFANIDDSMAERIKSLMERSAGTIKSLVEGET